MPNVRFKLFVKYKTIFVIESMYYKAWVTVMHKPQSTKLTEGHLRNPTRKQNLRSKLEFEIYEANSTKQKNDRHLIELHEIALKNE